MSETEFPGKNCCPQCFGWLVNPRKFPCGHYVCRSCAVILERECFLDEPALKRVCTGTPEQPHTMRCPTCGKEALSIESEFPGWKKIHDTSLKLARSRCGERIKCQCVKKKYNANTWCHDCQKALCGYCVDPHGSVIHRLEKFHGSTNNVPLIDCFQQEIHQSFCNAHPDKAAMYIHPKTRELFCQSCADMHGKHDLVELYFYVTRHAFYLRSLGTFISVLGKGICNAGIEIIKCKQAGTNAKAYLGDDKSSRHIGKAIEQTLEKFQNSLKETSEVNSETKWYICSRKSTASRRVCDVEAISEFEKMKLDLEAQCDIQSEYSRFSPESQNVTFVPTSKEGCVEFFVTHWKKPEPLTGSSDNAVLLADAFAHGHYCKMANILRDTPRNFHDHALEWLLFKLAHPYQPVIFDCVENPVYVDRAIEQSRNCTECYTKAKKRAKELVKQFPNSNELRFLRDVLITAYLKPVSEGEEKFVSHLRKFVEANYPPSFYFMGQKLLEKGDISAQEYLHKAAAYRHGEAEYALSKFYKTVKIRPELSKFYTEESSKHGYLKSIELLSDEYMGNAETLLEGKKQREKAQQERFLRMIIRQDIDSWHREEEQFEHSDRDVDRFTHKHPEPQSGSQSGSQPGSQMMMDDDED